MNELKNVKVSLISFVDKAANMRTFIMKDANHFDSFAVIRKFDEEKGLVYGVVYSPNDADAHGDFMSTETVEKAAHDFLSQSNTIKAMDTQHNLNVVDGCTIVESFINKGHEYFKDAKDKDAWVIAVKVENEEIKKSVKDGTFTGFSLYGTAERVEDADTEKSMMQKLGKKIVDKISKALDLESEDTDSAELIKSFEERYNKMQMRTVVEALSCEMYDTLYNDLLSIEERRDAIGSVMDEAWAKIETIELAKAEIDKVQKAGKVLSAGNSKKVQDAIDALNALLESAGKVEETKSKIKKFKGATEMENTDVKKTEHDAAIKAKDDEIQKLKDENEKLKNTSKGSQQEKEDGDGNKEKKIFKWV